MRHADPAACSSVLYKLGWTWDNPNRVAGFRFCHLPRPERAAYNGGSPRRRGAARAQAEGGPDVTLAGEGAD